MARAPSRGSRRPARLLGGVSCPLPIGQLAEALQAQVDAVRDIVFDTLGITH